MLWNLTISLICFLIIVFWTVPARIFTNFKSAFKYVYYDVRIEWDGRKEYCGPEGKAKFKDIKNV